MAKLLLLGIGIWLIITILRRYQKNMTPPNAQQAPEDMVKCSRCGVHLPKSESLYINNRYYCCQEHSNE